MVRVEKIAISLPKPVAQEMERLRKRRRQTRSAFILEAVRRELQANERARAIERYTRGYRNTPELASEIRIAEVLASQGFAEVPWE